MSFIKGPMGRTRNTNPYEALGYSKNPFPRQGEVRADVYVERPELAVLQRDLTSFLQGKSKGAVWALSGGQGLGKSNFLHHIDQELSELVEDGTLDRTAYQLLPSRSLTPGRIAEEILIAIGPERIEKLIEGRTDYPSTYYKNTDFGRFWEGVLRRQELYPDLAAEIHAQFLIRWISGHPTQQKERDRYGIIARERLPPAVALPYLRGIVDMLQADGYLDHIILLLDEFEDVQQLKSSDRTDYIQTLKGLLNVFNWEVLYLIIAGAPNAFTVMAESYPSMATRWQGRVAELQPLKNAAAAVKLANAYKETVLRRDEADLADLPPTDHEVEKKFIELFNESPGNVTQRALLSALHEHVEELVHESDSEAPKPAKQKKIELAVAPKRRRP